MRLQQGFSITNTLGVLLGLFAVSAILGAYYFIDQARDSSFDQNIKTLTTLQQIDAKWSAAILKTRSYTLQDFDQLAFYMTKIRNGLGTLDKQGMLDAKRVGEKTVTQYQIYKYSLKTKNEAVERYKSQQAILRNAVRYLPILAKTLQRTLTKNSTIENKKLNNTVMASNLLINQFLLSMVSAEKVQEKLTELSQQSENKNDEIKEKAQDYLTHIRLILKYKPKVKQMLQTAMSSDIPTLSTHVIEAYTHTQNIAKQRIKYLQKVMLAGGILLLAVMLSFLIHLRNSNRKVQKSDEKQKITRQKLLQAEDRINQVNKNILQTERKAASGQLAIGSFKQLHSMMPTFDKHIKLLHVIKKEPSLIKYENQLNSLITNMTNLHNEINTLNNLIDPQKNHNKQLNFDFNHIIQKALDVASFEAGASIVFTKQLSDIPIIQASPLDVFQIALKLFRQAAKSVQAGDKNIFVKTWATARYANMYMTLAGHNDLETLYSQEGLAIVHELIEQNQGILKLTPREQDSNGMVWISFPYTNTHE